ncbi:hypothetical protein V6C31_07190 [Caldibacillus debilis]|uniref:hypothetical protein n=1 Tax=Caldibacillus debilis TaxID=301148 RepID=UPI002FDB277B
MVIPGELIDLINQQSGTMEKKMIEAFVKEKSVDAIVAIAKASLKEEISSEA